MQLWARSGRPKFGRLAAWGTVLAVLGTCLSGTAQAAPIAVDYLITGGTVNLGGPNINVVTGAYTVTYADGAPTVGGSIASGPFDLTGLAFQITAPLAGQTAFALGGTIAGTLNSLLSGTGPIGVTIGGLFNVTGVLALAASPGVANVVGNGAIVGIAPFNFDVVGNEIGRTVIPEPGTAWLVGLGLAGMAGAARSRRRR